MSKAFLHFLLGFMCVLILDQSSKFFVAKFTRLAINSGVSFGMMAKIDGNIMLLFIIILLALFGYFLRSLWQKHPLAAGVLFGGAISNVMDRVLFGGVRDWFPLPFVHLNNNLADWSICFAIMYLFWQEVMRPTC